MEDEATDFVIHNGRLTLSDIPEGGLGDFSVLDGSVVAIVVDEKPGYIGVQMYGSRSKEVMLALTLAMKQLNGVLRSQ